MRTPERVNDALQLALFDPGLVGVAALDYGEDNTQDLVGIGRVATTVQLAKGR